MYARRIWKMPKMKRTSSMTRLMITHGRMVLYMGCIHASFLDLHTMTVMRIPYIRIVTLRMPTTSETGPGNTAASDAI